MLRWVEERGEELVLRLSATAESDAHARGRARQRKASEDVCVCEWASMGERWRGCEQCAQQVGTGLAGECMQGNAALGSRDGE